ncbi:MAG: Grx4 family monothiol glutaredoxin [Proteobacteria bacterium]|nr:MAG: Grx4 family monothiol glutaredoxin [Pseudomonadota bacterium]HAF89795.1 Grx4 family monothiol glutaredoxin [Deltaproteobacteria bacterium]|tara:strand:+ start:68 stop:784 length:717 start_codon:yes stop_codon:yes gene_type:complete
MQFKVISPDVESTGSTGSSPQSQIEQMLNDNPVFLFMKGTPESPQCGFSGKVTNILNAWNVPFKSFNVLADESIRQGIKDYANWQTIPQLYINKEFVGGSDVVEEISNNGELGELLNEAFPEMKITPPPPPAEAQEVNALEASVIMKENPNISLLDVRSPQERETACLENSVLLDQELVEEMLDKWDKDTAMMFICHTGQRSRQAAQYFAAQGFQKVYNISDGIHGWSSSVDSSIPTY